MRRPAESVMAESSHVRHTRLMTTPAAAPKRRSLVPGILLGVLGVLILVIAGVIYAASAIFTTFLPGSPVAQVPQPIGLELDAGSYDIYLSDDTTADTGDAVDSIVCVVENGGSTQEVAGADQAGVSVEVSGNQLIGSFTAAAGATTVTCDFPDGRDGSGYYYMLQPAAPPLPTPVIVMLVLGAVILLGAAALILRAVASRRQAA